jgi:hypothetical protein
MDEKSKYSTMRKLFLLLAAIVALSSCSITKRHYAPGYHVEWKALRQARPINESSSVVEDAKVFMPSNTMEEVKPITSSDEFALLEHAPLNSLNAENAQQEFSGSSENSNNVLSHPIPLGNDVEVNEAPLEWSEISSDTIVAPDFAPSDLGANTRVNRKALWGMILAVLGLPVVWLAIIGFLLCRSALDEIKTNGGRGKRMAQIGIAIPLLVAAILIIWALVFMIMLIVEQGIS